MRIKFKVLLIVLLFFLFLTNIFTDESEKKIEGDQTGHITGTINLKFTRYWYIDMTYNDKIIQGEFSKKVGLNLPKNRYSVEIRIGDKMYKGSIFRKSPVFGKSSYEIDILCYKTKLEGEITTFYKKVFKQHKIECILGDSFFEGLITYGRKNDEAKISIKNENFKIDGYTLMKDRKNRVIDYLINDKKIFGTVAIDRTIDEYNIKTEDLTDDELFFFLFLETFFKIDKRAEEESKKITKENQNTGPIFE